MLPDGMLPDERTPEDVCAAETRAAEARAAEVGEWDAATRETVRLLQQETGLDVATPPEMGRLIGRLQRLGGLLAESVRDDATRASAPAAADSTGPQPDEQPPTLAEFRIVGRLGAGGMGTVYLAEELALGRQVALKVIRPRHAADPVVRARFLREARAMAAVVHDHVMPILRVGEFPGGELPAGGVYLTMPILPGETLAERLTRANGRLPEDEVLEIARQAAQGLAALHAAGLVHRDLKPSNLWLEARPPGQPPRVRILDLGLARGSERPGELSLTSAIVGTPGYMAPEQAAGEPVDARSDLFSLGTVLYEMATGEAAFPGDSLYAVITKLVLHDPPPASQVSSGLATLVQRLLQKRAADRPASAADVEQAIVALQTTGDPAAPLARRRWLGTALGGLAILVAVVTIVLQNGQRYSVDVPDGAKLTVDAQGNSKVHLGAADAATARFPPLDADWAKRFATLTIPEQRVEMARELRRRNPGLVEEPYYSPGREGALTNTGIGVFTQDAADITPLAAWRTLQRVHLSPVDWESGGKGKLASLEALRGLPLHYVDVGYNPDLRDLSPLAGMRLEWLDLRGTGVTDLSVFKEIDMTGGLLLEQTPVRDLSPLAGKRLVELRIADTLVKDLAPLAGMRLEKFTFMPDGKQDLQVLRRMTTLKTINGRPAAEFWKQHDTKP